jgi:hypothetical protein
LITYVMVTRNRAERLGNTLAALGELPAHEAEVVVVDNGSLERRVLGRRLRNGIGVRSVSLGWNAGAAGRTAGVEASDASRPWIVMLDDDSVPVDDAFARVLGGSGGSGGSGGVPSDVGAVAAEVWVGPRMKPRRERGGLPEVFVGCGVAIRREVYLGLGGYDASMGTFGEEADLSARMIGAGMRVAYEPRLRVVHAREREMRSAATMLHNQVRNAGWVVERYAPDEERFAARRESRRQWRLAAERAGAAGDAGHAGHAGHAAHAGLAAHRRGLMELWRTRAEQRRTPLTRARWDRLTGLSAAREAIAAAQREARFSSAMVVEPGVNAWAVAQALEEWGVRLTVPGETAEVRVIGTMSPGPMLDAYERCVAAPSRRGPSVTRVVMPWLGAIDGTLEERFVGQGAIEARHDVARTGQVHRAARAA